MSLIIFNGSPRGKKSNSSIITSWFLEGYEDASAPIYYLNKINHHEEYAKNLLEYEQIALVFPLYVDGMPGIVKGFFETMAKYKAELKGKQVTYIIHSGFSDAIQNRNLERYLRRFSSIMDFQHHGVLILPGSEGFSIMHPNMLKKKRTVTARLAAQFKTQTPYNEDDLATLRGREKMTKGTVFMFNILSKFGITNMYWNMILKKNKAYKKRFDAPYADAPTPITSSSFDGSK